MTDDDTKLLASLTGYTPGPWTGWNMIHADTGIPMTPDEIGEMVKNNVLQSIKDGGSAERFMFVSGETPFGPADMCHVGNGPNCLRNTALIAAAPDLHRIATELAAENKRLRVENSGLSQMLAGQRIDLAQARAELGDTTMKNAHNITDRFTGLVLFTAEIQVADDAPMALRLGAATAVAVAAKADLRHADLRHADLSGADLRHADLSGADLREADLSGADLNCADLRRADLNCADLRHADLSGADLSEADLSEADLSSADLSEAYLNYADLSGADLRGAK